MASVRLVAWRGGGGDDAVVGVAAIELVEIALTIREVTIVRRDDRLRVMLPLGAAIEGDAAASRPVLQWGSADVARRFAAAVTARRPLEIAMAMGPRAPTRVVGGRK
jgi:hypothetical protein